VSVLSLSDYVKHGGITPGSMCALTGAFVHPVDGGYVQVLVAHSLVTTIVAVIRMSDLKAQIVPKHLVQPIVRLEFANSTQTHAHIVVHVPSSVIAKLGLHHDRYDLVMNKMCYTIIKEPTDIEAFRKLLP